nr:uncharacterized protein LOC127338188 [Lolium perenne]
MGAWRQRIGGRGILLGRGSIMRPGREHQQAPRQARSRAEVLGEAMTDGGHSQLRCRRRCMSRSMPPPGQGRAATTILLPAFRWNMEGTQISRPRSGLSPLSSCKELENHNSRKATTHDKS